jgi:hypothetical protein
MFDSVLRADPLTGKGIPEMVSRMECEILCTLIDNGITDSALQFTVKVVEDTVNECMNWIASNCTGTPGSIQEKAGRYFRIVFDAIYAECTHPDWLEECFNEG